MNTIASLLEGLTSADWDMYRLTRDEVLGLGSRQALPLVEQALARLAGKAILSFHRPDGMLIRASGASEEAYRQIMLWAEGGQLLADPAATQRLIITVGSSLNCKLMNTLSDYDTRSLQIYKLLGLQMQLRIMAG